MWFCDCGCPQVECPDCLKHYVPPKEEEKGEAVDDEAPEICGKCKDRKVERKEAIIELVQTEINYGNDLQILKEVRYQYITHFTSFRASKGFTVPGLRESRPP